MANEQITVEEAILEVLDTKGVLRCVRFASGHVGVVNVKGKTLLELGQQYQRLEFAEQGFLRGKNGRWCFVDRKNGAVYARMPELIQFGSFELLSIGGYLCTRTKKRYQVKAVPAEAWHGKQGLYLSLPYKEEPAETIKSKMIAHLSRYLVCLLKGDRSGVYWKMREFEDHSLLVMDDKGNYYHVSGHVRTGNAQKRHLGTVENEADRVQMIHTVNKIEEQLADQLKCEAEQEREQQMATFASAEPFQIGNKWGLRQKGRIVVPPIYRLVREPVGRYCAFEKNPKQWGVMAVDGQIEVEPKYEEVVIHPNGMVELTVRSGKVVTLKLGIRGE